MNLWQVAPSPNLTYDVLNNKLFLKYFFCIVQDTSKQAMPTQPEKLEEAGQPKIVKPRAGLPFDR